MGLAVVLSALAHGGALVLAAKVLRTPSRDEVAVPVASKSVAAESGETFELSTEHADEGNPTASPPAVPAKEAPGLGTRNESPLPARSRGSSTPKASANAESLATASGSGQATLFGAVGDRSAVDLTTAFTRAFPHAGKH